MTTLKTITQILALVAVFTFSTSFAEASTLSKGKKTRLHEITKIVDKQIDYPEVAREEGITGTVKAQIQVTETGEIAVEEINGHPQLKDYVQKQLSKVKVDNIGLIGESFIAKFDFRN
jgi:outer membrane biosynthesis protein TonB